MLRWLDYVPLAPLVVAAVILALSPPLAEPHLLQKLKLLAAGELTQPIDWFDFALHAFLPVLLLLKFLRVRQLGRARTR